jgi:3-methyladenine DNA glycosylase AlkD
MREIAEIRAELEARAEPERARVMTRYLRTDPGGYGEGDVLLGVPVPGSRSVARSHRGLPHAGVLELLADPVHEMRLVGLVIWTERYRRRRTGAAARDEIHEAYLAHSDRVNNWDLVDLSAPTIVGRHLLDQGAGIGLLRDLAGSELVWDRRIAVVATMPFSRSGDTEPAYEVAGLLLGDEHELIHKACGWMLREAGKAVEAELVSWVETYAHRMARTQLRYAIERLPREERARLMAL